MKAKWICSSTAAMLIAMTQGCTMIGHSIGESIDKNPRTLDYFEAGKLKAGDEKIIVLRDSSIVKGKFLGLDTLNEREYQDLYMRVSNRLDDPGDLPQIGDTLLSSTRLVLKNFNCVSNKVPIQWDKYHEARHFTLNFESLPGGKPRQLNLSEIDNLNFAGGRSYNKSHLLRLAFNGDLPIKSRMLLAVNDTLTSIELNDIARIDRITTGRKGTWIGTVTGAVLDAGVIAFTIVAAVVISSMRPMFGS